MELASKLRKALGLNLNQMSKTLGISRQAYQALEERTVNPSKNVLLSLYHLAKQKLGWDGDKFFREWEKEE